MYKCTLENEGFIANYYPGKAETQKAIISVGGSGCNEKTCITMAEHLIEEGYNVLVLGFYYWKGMSRELAGIPVDYAEKAARWLLQKQGVTKVAMTGASMGAAYTLLCASLIPEITCVIPVVPFDHVFEGTTAEMKRKHCSWFTYHGKDLPYTPLELLDMGIRGWLRCARKADGYGLARFMRYGYDRMTPLLTEESRIRVENMNADVLLLAVKDDDCWPSDEAVPRMVERLETANYAHRVEAHVYEKAGHLLGGGFEQLSAFVRFLSKLMFPAEKRYPEECDEARADSLRRIHMFLREW